MHDAALLQLGFVHTAIVDTLDHEEDISARLASSQETFLLSNPACVGFPSRLSTGSGETSTSYIMYSLCTRQCARAETDVVRHFFQELHVAEPNRGGYLSRALALPHRS